jgi:hypothetical protein
MQHFIFKFLKNEFFILKYCFRFWSSLSHFTSRLSALPLHVALILLSVLPWGSSLMAQKTPNSSVHSTKGVPNPHFPCIRGTITTPNGLEMPDVTVMITQEADTCEQIVPVNGLYTFEACMAGNYTITPHSKRNFLDGLTVLDLLLIRKYTLGLFASFSPYALLAADANRSNNVNTLDVLALRRLLLGIDQKIPHTHPWRFVPKNYVFPDVNYPFEGLTSLPESITATLPPCDTILAGQDFIAIKTGDVSGPVPPCQGGQPQAFAVLVPASVVQAGTPVSLPLRFEGQVLVTALQAAIRFDPAALEFIGPSTGNAEGLTPDCFGLTDLSRGIVRLIWLAPDPAEAPLRAGQLLCRLHFKAKRPLTAAEMALRFDETDRLRPEAYPLAADVAYPLSLQSTAVEERGPSEAHTVGLSVECRPNPAGEMVTLWLQARQPVQGGRLFILDGFGRRVAYRELNLETGALEIQFEEAVSWSPGFYTWVFLQGSERLSEGNFIKTQ